MALTFSPSSANVGQEVTASIVFNDDDVSWVYIDWGDGDDNSLDNAIYQWYKIDSNSKTASLTHIYTKAGTFTPVIRTVNSQGFLSKFFFRTGTVSNLPEPSENVGSDIANITISDTTPVAVNRVENKEVLSGIDNSIFKEGAKDVFFYRPPILSSTSNMAGETLNFEITYIDEMPQSAQSTTGVYDKNDTGVSLRVRTLTNVSFDSINNGTNNKLVALGKVKEILEFKQLTVKQTTGTNADVNDFNKLKTFLIAKSEVDDLFYPITYVSNGDPIKQSSDRNVTLDFTQSRAKASNQSISKYYIDNGKVFFGAPETRWQATSATQLTDDTKTSESTKSVSYTYMAKPKGVGNNLAGASNQYTPFETGSTTVAPHFHTQSAGAYNSAEYRSRTKANQFPLDDFNKFYDQHHLSRVNVRTEGGTNGALDTFKLVYRAAPPTNSNNLFIDSNTLSADYTSGSYYNAFEGGTDSPVSIDKWNNTTYVDQNSASRNATEYFLLANDVKTNKVFFNTTPFAQNYTSGSNSTSINIAGVYYLRTGTRVDGDQFTEFAEWVPVEFTDTTKITREFRDAGNTKFTQYSDSFTKPGFVEFDMPNDWAKISISGTTGGIFNQAGATGSPAVGGYGRPITATMGNNNNSHGGSAPYDLTNCEINVTNVTDSGTVTLANSGYSNRDIGEFEYVYQVNAGAAAGGVYWVASGNTANNKLYLIDNAGQPLSSGGGAYGNGDNISGFMRKVNAYDVFDGTFKFGVTSDKGEVPDFTTTNYPYTFMWDSDKTTIASSFVNVYPLKIVLQGSHFSNTAGNIPGAELWDVLPYNNSNSQVITQKDNTAFDMSFMEITSNVSVAYAGTYYSSISKNGKVTIVRTGTPIQKITFAGNALGDEATFSFSEEYLSYNTLHKLRRMEAESVRMMWDEKQKDGTYVRFFGVIEGVSETHSNQGPKASKPFTFTMIVDSICLLTKDGILMSDITPLGGVGDGSAYS